MYNWDEIIHEFLIEIGVRGYAEQTIYNYSTNSWNRTTSKNLHLWSYWNRKGRIKGRL